MIKDKTYKYITIKQIDDETWEGKPVYRIVNNKSKSLLGMLSYYVPWKQYVFSSREGCVFNTGCLHDVLDFMENEIK